MLGLSYLYGGSSAIMKTFDFGHLLLTLFLLTSFSWAWPWPPSVPERDGLIQRRADPTSGEFYSCVAMPSPCSDRLVRLPASDSSPAETGNAKAADTGAAAKTAAGSGTAAASKGKGAAQTKSGATKAAKTGAQKTKAASTKTSAVDPRLPPGGVNMITPSAIAQPSYYKVGDHVTFAWNYTSLSVKPARIDAFVSCAPNSATYTLLNNATFDPTATVVWDTSVNPSDTAPFLTETYTLVVYDASKDPTAVPVAGHLGKFDQFYFGMYIPQPYTGLSGKSFPVLFEPSHLD